MERRPDNREEDGVSVHKKTGVAVVWYVAHLHIARWHSTSTAVIAVLPCFPKRSLIRPVALLNGLPRGSY